MPAVTCCVGSVPLANLYSLMHIYECVSGNIVCILLVNHHFVYIVFWLFAKKFGYVPQDNCRSISKIQNIPWENVRGDFQNFFHFPFLRFKMEFKLFELWQGRVINPFALWYSIENVQFIEKSI